MIELQEIIRNFTALGMIMQNGAMEVEVPGEMEFSTEIRSIIQEMSSYNAWFTQENTRRSIKALATWLNPEMLHSWTSYDALATWNRTPKKIGVIMAGNIPLVGFHDFLCVLFSGHIFHGKLSSQDNVLLPKLAKILCCINPDWKEMIRFTETTLAGCDAYIATGSGNTSRYFEYYFGKYPHIIRKNRNGIAILNGTESLEQLQQLSDDMFMYFGLGCRNVSKIYVPSGYTFDRLLQSFHTYEHLSHHHKYRNNYDYNKALFLIDKKEHFDNGFCLLQENTQIASPVSVIHYEYYQEFLELKVKIEQQREMIQCIIGDSKSISCSIPFGTSQQPGLMDYADGVDVMHFLLNLK